MQTWKGRVTQPDPQKSLTKLCKPKLIFGHLILEMLVFGNKIKTKKNIPRMLEIGIQRGT